MKERDLSTRQTLSLGRLLSEEELKNIGIEERLQYLSRLLNEAGEEPNIIEQLFFNKRQEAKAIQEIKIAVIQQRRQVIEAMGQALTVTVLQEEALLGVRYSAALIATSEVMVRDLNKIDEAAISTLLDDYVDTLNHIQSNSQIDADLKQQLLDDAKTRLAERQDDTYASFKSLLHRFRDLVGDVVEKIKNPKLL